MANAGGSIKLWPPTFKCRLPSKSELPNLRGFLMWASNLTSRCPNMEGQRSETQSGVVGRGQVVGPRMVTPLDLPNDSNYFQSPRAVKRAHLALHANGIVLKRQRVSRRV
ncbi:unnamed protein product [Calypogeia fissa]